MTKPQRDHRATTPARSSSIAAPCLSTWAMQHLNAVADAVEQVVDVAGAIVERHSREMVGGVGRDQAGWMRSRSAHKTFPSTASTFYLKGADPQRFPFPTANSAIPGSFRRRSEGFNRAHIAVTCNRRGLPSEFVNVRSIPDRTGSGGANAQIEPGCFIIVFAFGFRVAKLRARDGNRDPFGSSENHCHAAACACSAPHWPGCHCTPASEGVQLSRGTQNGHLDVRMNFPAPQRARLTRGAKRSSVIGTARRSRSRRCRPIRRRRAVSDRSFSLRSCSTSSASISR